MAGGLLAGSCRYLNSLDLLDPGLDHAAGGRADGRRLQPVGSDRGGAACCKLLPALLNNWGVSPDWLTILFGIGVLQVLTTAPPGIVDQVPKDIARLGRLLRGLVAAARRPRAEAAP